MMDVLTFYRRHCTQKTMSRTLDAAAFPPSRLIHHACTFSTQTSVHVALPARSQLRQSRRISCTKRSSHKSSAPPNPPGSLGNKANLLKMSLSTMALTFPHAAAEHSRSMLRRLSPEQGATTASPRFPTHEAYFFPP